MAALEAVWPAAPVDAPAAAEHAQEAAVPAALEAVLGAVLAVAAAAPSAPAVKNNMRMRGLNIQITAECNYRCPWCIEVKSLKEKSGPITPKNLEKLLCHIAKNPYDNYSLQGGEPLLFPQPLLDIIRNLRVLQPNAQLQVLTNATGLTESLVQQFNDLKIRLIISLEAEGYKGIMHLINSAKEPERIINNINALKIKQIRSIANSLSCFAQGALTLHALFPTAGIEVTPDFYTMSRLTENDIEGMRSELTYLKQKTTHIKHWFTMARGFYHKCINNEYKYLFATNEIINDCPIGRKVKSGCAIFTHAMPPGIYEKYRQTIKEIIQCP